MKNIVKTVVIIFFLSVSSYASAQLYGINVYGGYQHHFDDIAPHTFTLRAEADLYAVTSHACLSVSDNYFSFSPVGLILFAPLPLMKSFNKVKKQGGQVPLPILLLCCTAWEFYHNDPPGLDWFWGWDALKFTKLKNISDSFYIQGSLNAGLRYMFDNGLSISAYYEFNHRWTKSQPEELTSHSFGIRLGYNVF